MPSTRYPPTEYELGFSQIRATQVNPLSRSPSQLKSSGICYPISHFVDCTKFSVVHHCFLAAVDSGVEPRHFREAVTSPLWRETMAKDLDALDKNSTWELVDIPIDKKVIGNKWVYKIKYKADGTIERYKARLVILGNRQVEGVDFK